MNIDISSSVFIQVIIMAIYIFLGFILTKIRFLSNTGTKQMSDLLINIVTPCVIITAFQDGFTSESFSRFIIAVAMSVGYHVVGILLVNLIFIKSKHDTKKAVNKFSCIYSNCGFMGIPLLNAALGPQGVFIGSAYLAIFNLFVWTQGYSMFVQGSQKLSYKKIFFNPGMTGITISVIILVLKIKIPMPLNSALNGMAALNTPIAMILLGVYLAESNILECLKNISMYAVCALKLIVFPLVAALVFKFMNIDSQIAITVLLSAACPCAAVAAILASQTGNDSGYASSLVSVSTLLSLVTLPLVTKLASEILM